MVQTPEPPAKKAKNDGKKLVAKSPKCRICQKVFKRKTTLRNHIRKLHHPTVRKVVCPFCKRLYGEFTQLRVHLGKEHLGKRLKLVNGKGFIDSTALNWVEVPREELQNGRKYDPIEESAQSAESSDEAPTPLMAKAAPIVQRRYHLIGLDDDSSTNDIELNIETQNIDEDDSLDDFLDQSNIDPLEQQTSPHHTDSPQGNEGDFLANCSQTFGPANRGLWITPSAMVSYFLSFWIQKFILSNPMCPCY